MNIITWFTKEPLNELVPDPCLLIGGTNLIEEFIQHVEESDQAGTLALAVPYINPKLVGTLTALKAIAQHRIALTVVTGTGVNAKRACQTLVRLPWHTVDVFESRTLHAKAYAFVGKNGYGTALVGSHNLTFAGTLHNDEAGVLMVSRRKSDLTTTIQQCVEHIKELGKNSKRLHDNHAWPEENSQLRITA